MELGKEPYSDSKLIVNQVHGEYKVRHEDLVPYHNAIIYIKESSETSASTMYLASKMHMQTH